MLFLLPSIIGSNGVWITPCCVGAISLIGIFIYSRYLTRKTHGEYHGIYMNKTHGDNYWEYTINANLEEVNSLVSLVKDNLGNNKFSQSACLSLQEFLTNIIETNDKLDTIDILLDASGDSIKINIKDLGVEREGEFAFKNETEFNRETDYTRVLALNSNQIIISN